MANACISLLTPNYTASIRCVIHPTFLAPCCVNVCTSPCTSVAIVADTSGDFQRILNSVLQCDRDPLDAPLDASKVSADAAALHKAGEKVFGTDEAVFISILTKRSFPHIAAVSAGYEQVST